MGKHKIKRSPPIHRKCLDCGVGFIAQNSEVAKGRGLFCSAKCRGKSQSKPLPSGVCQQCGTFFTAKFRAQKNKKYCSRECSGVAHRGKTKKFNPGRPYKHEKWMLAVLNRDLKCVECGAITGLQAHHIKSWKSHPDLRDDIENGVTLCGTCHHGKHPYLPVARFTGGQSLKCCVVCEQGFIVRKKTQRTCSHECGGKLKKQKSAMQRQPA